MSCCDGIIKSLLFIFNVVFSLIGLALIVVSGYLLSKEGNFSDLVQDVDTLLKAPQIFLIVLGVIIFFIATLGCCGAIRENRCMLITFGICLLCIFIVQLGIGSYVLTKKTDFNKELEQGLQQSFDKIDNPDIKKIFQSLEKNLECCGVRSSLDYIYANRAIPKSCCQDKSDCIITPNKFFDQGCAPAIREFFKNAAKTLGYVVIGFSIVEVVGALFAFRLASISK